MTENPRNRQDDPSRYHVLDPAHVDPARVSKEREKARKLRKSQWWLTQVNRGLCHYCGQRFKASELTLDHVVPIARGGTSTPGNVVPACKDCNREKKLDVPVEKLFEQLERERQPRSGSEVDTDLDAEDESDR